MTGTIVSPETLLRLQDIHNRWNKLTKYSGELHYQLRTVEREITALNAELDKLDQEKLDIDDEIEKQFGSTGSVILATGEFVADEK